MDSRFNACLEEHKLARVEVQDDLVKKEFAGAASDLKWAEKSLSEGNHKWAAVQAYYSIFHSAKALSLSKGYMEKSHHCLMVAFKVLFVDTCAVERKYLDWFRDCMALRHDADYGLIYSLDSANEAVRWAREFIEMAEKLVNVK